MKAHTEVSRNVTSETEYLVSFKLILNTIKQDFSSSHSWKSYESKLNMKAAQLDRKLFGLFVITGTNVLAVIRGLFDVNSSV